VGTWEVRATGGDVAASGLTTDGFADRCAAVFSSVELVFESIELRDDEGLSGGGIAVSSPVDLSREGPQTVGVLEVDGGEWDRFALELGAPSVPAVQLVGVLTCSTGTVGFDWTFDGPLRSSCDSGGVSIDNKGRDETLFVVSPESIFSVSDGDAGMMPAGLHLLEADDNVDGVLTLPELGQVSAEEAGLDSDSVDLRSHVTGQVQRMVSVEGGTTCLLEGGE